MTYDPFVRGPLQVRQRTLDAADARRARVFPLEIWQPDDDGAHPLIAYSPHAGGSRLVATLLCEHLASHGYAVAALDHSEVVAADLAGKDAETQAQRAARVDAIIASRVPDVRFLLDKVAAEGGVDSTRIGLVGHSFGGWTVLATAEVDERVRSVVAMGPGGGSDPKPGVLALTLTFALGRDVPTLYLAAEDDVPIPLRSVRELFDRTPSARRMFVLRRADHQHFVDDVERAHEAVRTSVWPEDAAWIAAAMKRSDELASGDEAHAFVHSLTLAHLDATLRDDAAAAAFLDAAARTLAEHGVDAYEERR